MATDAGSDEALARALQMQYDQEQQQLRSQSQQQRQPPSSTIMSTPNNSTTTTGNSLRSNRASQNNPRTVDPNASRSEQRKQRKQQQRERRIPPTVTGMPVSAATQYPSAPSTQQEQHVSDEELARRLAAEEEAAAMSQAISASTTYDGGPEQAPSNYHGRSTSNNNTDSSAFQDELTSQEWRDAQMAQKLQEHEERKAAREHARLEAIVAEGERNRMARENVNGYHQGPRNQFLNSKKRVYGCMGVSLLIFIGAIVGLVVYFVVLDGSSSGLVDGVTDTISDQDEADTDPFNNQTTARPWPNNGEGLRIGIYNALQTKWYQYFYDSIADWNSGYPRALQIESEVLDYDYNCEKINNAIKVCNGDYNKTGWRGINELTYVNGLITSSRARMNDFYLINNKPDDDPDRAQYVMCHELGHGFGLLHTDEIFDNPDTWNCMDYTRNYGGNMSLPGEVNHVSLFNLYGLVPGSPAYPPEGGGRRKQLRQLGSTLRNEPAELEFKPEPHPEWLLQEMDKVYNSLTGQRLELHRWKTVHQNDFSEAHEVELAEGHTFQVRKLLA